MMVQIFITGWWLCPELYLRRPFQHLGLSRLDALLEARAKQGVQVLFFNHKRSGIMYVMKDQMFEF
jgi:phospholipase D1/2